MKMESLTSDQVLNGHRMQIHSMPVQVIGMCFLGRCNGQGRNGSDAGYVLG